MLAGVYALTPDGLQTDALLHRTQQVLDGGAAAVQYRDKTADDAERRHRAGLLAELCEGRALFIVNDDVRLALEVGADGVHLGQEDGSVAQARRLLGSARLLGVSCRGSAELVRRAAAEGADHVAFGCCFPSSTKPDAPLLKLAELGKLCRLAESLDLQTVAIGGINPQNLVLLQRQVNPMLKTIAVCEALFAAADVRAATDKLNGIVCGEE